MQAIDGVAGFSTPVWATDSGGTSSHPEAGIAVDLGEFERIRKRADVRQLRQFVRFILAHEKSHQIQYLLYSKASVKSEDPEQRRVYECQADILAGKLLAESFGSPTPQDLQSITEALQVAFEIGTEEYTGAADHPSHQARRTAVRLGMARGTMTNQLKLPPSPYLAGMIASIAEKTDSLPGESVMDWSYRLAKKIVHYNRAAVADIRLDENKINWDKRASNPFVNFSLTYKNVGKRTVKVDMEVQCALVPRDDSDDTLRWLKWSVKKFSFTLRPGQKFDASGTLMWGCDAPANSGLCPDYSKLMPSLVFPPDATALMSCEYID